MSVETVRVCKCDICGKVLPKETGFLRWQSNIKLGSNVKDADSVIYEDVCDECADAIRKLIDKRSGWKLIQCVEETYANDWLDSERK